MSAPASLDPILSDLDRRLQQLSQFIDTHMPTLDPTTYAHLVSLQGQLASRMGRLLRDRQALHGDTADELTRAIHEALDDISIEWGVEL